MLRHTRNIPSILKTESNVGILKDGRRIEQVEEMMKATESI
jgi:hypothetical protein